MALMKPAVQDNAFFKCACRGLSGSGKSWFALNASIGLWDRLGRTNPVFYLDTENALSYILPHYEHLGVKVFELRSRSFRDLAAFWREAREANAITIIDSITHFNEDMVNTYLEDKNKKRLAVWDWNPLKKDWRKHVLEHIANDPLHIIVCGRLSDVFKPVEIDGSTVIAAVDSKMTAEKNTEYEPSLTIEMERFTLSEDEIRERARAIKDNKPIKSLTKSASYRMTIIKDRTNTLHGMYEFEPQQNRWVEVDNPIWQSIQPHIEALKIGADYKGLDTTRTSAGMFGKPDESWAEAERQKAIHLEEIEAELKTRFGQSKEDKAAGVALLKEIFGTPSWTAIQSLELNKLEECHKALMLKLYQPNRPFTADEIETRIKEMDSTAPAPVEVEVKPVDVLGELESIYNQSLILRPDMDAALKLCEYDLIDDPAKIKNMVKSRNATDWKTAVGTLVNWMKGEQ